jgi:adenylosuccinate lyase
VERIILPDATELLDYMLNRLGGIIQNLTVFPENMLRNMRSTYDVPFSGRVMTKLIDHGFSREQAYDLVQPKAMQAWEEQRSFRSIVEADATITETLSPDEIADCFNPTWHLKHVDTIFRRLGLIQGGATQ